MGPPVAGLWPPPQAGRVLAAVSITEGQLDAATSWDSAVISLGFQQWSMHVSESGPNLLARIKRIDDVVYDALARASGVDTTASPAAAAPKGDTASRWAAC